MRGLVPQDYCLCFSVIYCFYQNRKCEASGRIPSGLRLTRMVFPSVEGRGSTELVWVEDGTAVSPTGAVFIHNRILNANMPLEKAN